MGEITASRRSAGEMWETCSVFQGGFIAVISTAASGREFGWGSISQRRMRPMMVVIMSPQRQLAPRVCQSEEYFHVQALVAQSSVEALDVPVLDRSPWTDEVQMYAVCVRQRSMAFDENSVPLSTVIDCGAPRMPTIFDSAIATFSPLSAVSA